MINDWIALKPHASSVLLSTKEKSSRTGENSTNPMSIAYPVTGNFKSRNTLNASPIRILGTSWATGQWGIHESGRYSSPISMPSFFKASHNWEWNWRSDKVGVGARKRTFLSLGRLPIEEKDKGKGSCFPAKDLMMFSSLAGSIRGLENRVIWGRDSISMSWVLIWRRASTFQAFNTWFSSAGSK